MFFIINVAAAAGPGGGDPENKGPPGGDQFPAPEPPFKVLVVDDDQDIHEALADILSDGDIRCSVRHAFHGQQALDMMKQESPDLLILDIRMPVMDGLALREEMLHDPELSNVQIAVFTGHSMNTTELQVLLADFYLPKPVAIDALLSVLMTAKNNISTMAAHSRKRAEATISRLGTVIEDLAAFRDSLIDRLRKK